MQTAVDGEQALGTARGDNLDLILLDVMLPGMSGVEVLRVLRREGIATPVIILSAKGDEIDRVVGLQVGADDYVAKPFSRPELLARIEAVLRRGRRELADADPNAPEPTELHIGPIRIDRARRTLAVNGSAGPPHHEGVRSARPPRRPPRPHLHPRAAAGPDLGLRLRRRGADGRRPRQLAARQAAHAPTATTTSAPCVASATRSRPVTDAAPDQREAVDLAAAAFEALLAQRGGAVLLVVDARLRIVRVGAEAAAIAERDAPSSSSG